MVINFDNHVKGFLKKFLQEKLIEKAKTFRIIPQFSLQTFFFQ